MDGKKKVISLGSVEKLVKSLGPVRVSEEAKEELSRLAEEYIVAVSEKAIKLANHTGRKTVKIEDIKLALEE